MPNSPGDTTSKVTVIIPNWNGKDWLGKCLHALARLDMTEFDIVVVDNASCDGSVTFIRHNYPRIHIINLSSNTGFANAANVGTAHALTPYVAFLNADTEVYPDWLSSLVDRIESSPPDVAGISSQMLRMDDPDRIDDAGDELSWYGAAAKRGHGRRGCGVRARSRGVLPLRRCLPVPA
jgi:GT2 family glycosyltransferase